MKYDKWVWDSCPSGISPYGEIPDGMIMCVFSELQSSNRDLRGFTGALLSHRQRRPQGVLNPSVYNMFMDSFYEAGADVPTAMSTHPTIMYADDVRMQSRSPQGVQLLLKRAHRWAQSNAMAWNSAKNFV